MKNKLINTIKLLLILTVFFYIGNLYTSLFVKLGFDLKTFTYIDSAYADTLVGLTLFILVFLIYRKAIINDWEIFKLDLKNNIRKCIMIFAILMGVKLLASVGTSILSILLDVELIQSNNQNILEILIESAPFMMLISSVLIAPFTEEVIFRLGFKKIIANKTLFIITSGLIFGLMHVLPSDLNITIIFLQSIIYLALGFTLAYIYEKNNNIFYVILPHAFNNLLGLLAALTLL